MSVPRRIIFWLCVVIAAAAAGAAVFYVASRQSKENDYEQLQQQVIAQQQDETLSAAAPSQTVSPAYSETDGAEETVFVSPVDFDALQAVNPDVYAWIEIPDTDVSYPVVQHADDISYYLTYSYDNQYSVLGSIFSEPGSAKDMSDFNTVIYGHNMNDGSMFGCLKSFRDEEYLSAHRDVIIYPPDAPYTYRIFAAVTYTNDLISAAFDDSTPEGRQAFLDSVTETRDLNSHVTDDIDVTTDDHILTLSTCMGDSSKRFLIEAVLTDIDE